MLNLKKFLGGTLGLLMLLSGFSGPVTAMAATSPTLGASAPFSVIGHTQVTDVPASVISGNVGLDAAGTNYVGLTSVEVAGTIYDTNGTGPDGGAGNNPTLVNDIHVDASAAFDALNAGSNADANCVGGVHSDGTDLTTLSPLGPGVYCSAGSFLLTGNLNLTGSGVWVFKTVSSLITSSGSSITGGDPCNIWWRIGSSATIETTTAFKGTIIALTDVHMNTGATLNGRAFAETGAVTLQQNTISGPVCATSVPPTGNVASSTGSINVVKVVVNDNGGTSTVADFPLFINQLPVTSGVTNGYSFLSSGPYTVTETGSANYAASFAGDCDATGLLNLHANENLFCVLTNNDIGAPVVVPPVPPIIDIVKVPSPLALPAGPGAVLYNYTVRNVGTVPMTNVTVVDDSCGPVSYTSGDLNNNATLEVGETWRYGCLTTLNETHTNTAVATGWANGLSASDVATATVVVGVPLIPPLIHVTKIPNPLTLPAGGGMVTYTETVTNPGTVALHNVTLSDDKCSPVTFISGDTNGDSLLDPSESWKYTCRHNLTATTTNIATATGEANGFTVRDLAIVTVVVASAVPGLPNTGFAPVVSVPVASLLIAGISVLSLGYVLRKRSV